MRLIQACFWLGGIYLAVGLGAALLLQAELWSPGLMMPPEPAAAAYAFGRQAHMGSLQFGVPLALVASLGAAAFSSARDVRSAALFGWGVLVMSIALVGLDAAMPFERSLRDAAAALVIAAAGAGVALTIYADRTARFSRLVFAALGALLVVAGIGLSRLIDQDGHAALDSTYLAVAAQHAYGTALVMWAFAVTTAWAARKGQAPETWVSAILAVGLFGSAAQMVRWTMGLGLAGMPRGYMDYPEAYAAVQRQTGLWATVFVVFVLLGIWRTWRLSRQAPPNPAEVFH